jgi:hypothetical protein
MQMLVAIEGFVETTSFAVRVEVETVWHMVSYYSISPLRAIEPGLSSK